MKKLVILSVIISFSLYSFGQSTLPQGSRVPKNKDMYANVGFGVSSWGVPVYAGFEYMIHNEVSIGGEISYRSQSEVIADRSYTIRASTIAARGNYHFNNLLKLKAPFLFYAGVSLGYSMVSTNVVSGFGYDGARGSGLFFSLQTGGNYYFTKNWAANVELGIGNIVGLKLGASYLF
jgi:outer membrane immunogenic protein